jgi:amino acid transporter
MIPFDQIDTSAPFPMAFKHLGNLVHLRNGFKYLYFFGWIFETKTKGEWVHLVLSIGPLVSLTGTLLMTVYSLGRFMYAISNDGILFKFLSVIHPRLKIPLYANLTSYIISILLIVVFDIRDLIGFTDIIGFIQYGSVACGILVIRYYTRPIVHIGQIVPDGGSDEETIEFEVLDRMTHSLHDDRSSTTEPLLDNNQTRTSEDVYVSRHRTPGFYVKYMKTRPNFALGLILTLIVSNIFLSLMFFHFSIKLVITISMVFVNIIIFLLFSLLCKQNADVDMLLSFKVPLVPLIPMLALVLNIFFAMTSDYKDWIGFVVVIFFGLPIYIFYGFKHSKLN